MARSGKAKARMRKSETMAKARSGAGSMRDWIRDVDGYIFVQLTISRAIATPVHHATSGKKYRGTQNVVTRFPATPQIDLLCEKW